MGYSVEETGAVPEGPNLGLGCGNPQAIAALKPGETVLDLGSCAQFDAFLAAREVGATALLPSNLLNDASVGPTVEMVDILEVQMVPRWGLEPQTN